MATRKSRRSKKRHAKADKNIDHHKSKKRHHKKRATVSWKDHYTYESSSSSSSSSSSPSPSSTTNKNNGNIVNGLRDFLALKKDKK